MKKNSSITHVSHKTDSNKPYFILQFFMQFWTIFSAILNNIFDVIFPFFSAI